ncbi:hypothetical protein AHAS_Ahas11G0084400 [Arachis hypogaea]
MVISNFTVTSNTRSKFTVIFFGSHLALLNSSPAIPTPPHPLTDTVFISADQPDAPLLPMLSLTLLPLFRAPLFQTGFAFFHSFKPLFTDDTTIHFFFGSKHG